MCEGPLAFLCFLLVGSIVGLIKLDQLDSSLLRTERFIFAGHENKIFEALSQFLRLSLS